MLCSESPAMPLASQPLIDAVDNASSADELLRAVRQLAASSHPNMVIPALACLVKVLGYNNPGAAVAAVDGLIAAGPSAVSPLLEGLDDHNYGARAWAVRALAGIGDVRGLPLLVDALGGDVAASVRRAAARGLGSLQLTGLALEEQASISGSCLSALEAACRDGEWVVRYAVAVGLEGLGPHLQAPSSCWQRAEAALEQLTRPDNDNPRVVQLRATLALNRLREP